jgi:uncharacterized protein (DUF433 family)
MIPSNQYVDIRNGGYYIAGTRIGLDVIAYGFRNGNSPEDLFEKYPSLGSLAKVYGAITFILEHPVEVDAYLKDQDRILEEFKTQHPMPADMIERFERVKNGTSSKLA